MSFSIDKQVCFYRDDLNHPTVSGNKLHKLTPNLELAGDKKCSIVLSFGGPYSNHLHALAWACKQRGLASIGVVRGELHSTLTPCLRDCQTWGMRLIPMQRKDYRACQEALSAHDGMRSTPQFLQEVLQEFLPESIQVPNDTLVIPEGGSNALAITSLTKAYRPIFTQREFSNITHVMCATGTGATLAGLYNAAPSGLQVIGVQAVAEGDATLNRIRGWLGNDIVNLSIVPGHLGGFGKTPAILLEFISAFESRHDIPLDPVYNGKVMFKIAQMGEQGLFNQDDKILVVHTGGLQGKQRH